MGDHGLVIGNNQGVIEEVQDNSVAPSRGDSGFSFVYEHDGVVAVVTKFFGNQVASNGSSDNYDVADTAYVVNLHNKGSTRYSTGFDPNSHFRSDGVDYVFTSAGLMSVEGDSDNGADISWVIDYGRLNMGSEVLKRISNIYVGCETKNKLQLAVYSSNEEFSYTTRGYNEELQQQRFDVGRGLRANWFGLRLSGVGAADVATLSCMVSDTARRI
jgi:hypothetical protein